MSSQAYIRIVQVIRELHGNSGSSLVAQKISEQLDDFGISHREIFLRDKRIALSSSILEKILVFKDVVYFTILGSALIWKSGSHEVSIVHNEAFFGDIHIDHGLHKEVIRSNPRLIFINPIHIFLLIREEIRHRMSLYSRLVVLSPYAKEILKKNYPTVAEEKIVTIPNGVDLEKFILERNHCDSSFRILFVGHEFDRKGLEYLLEAMSCLPENFCLRVVGGHRDLIDKYERKASELGVLDRVDFLGRRDDIPEILSSSDALVLPSRYESWGLVAVEALASGVPVLMTRVGCAEEVIVDGENGFLISKDPKDISQRLLQMSTPELKVQMESFARRSAQPYGWGAVAKRYLSLAEDVRKEKLRRNSKRKVTE